MDRTERLYSYEIMVIILLSISFYLTEIIPRPYDWLVYLSWLSLAIVRLVIPLVKTYKHNLGFFFFALGSILLLPLAVSNCGILHKTFLGFLEYESAFDWSIKSIILILYAISFVYLIKQFRK